MARPINIDAPLSAGIRRNKPGKKNFKRTAAPIKKSSMGVKKRFGGGAGKPSGARPIGGGAGRRQSGGGFKTLQRSIGSNDNREVRLNISNLAPSVLSKDLRQLFTDFRVKNVSVNFNEQGRAAGTGDLTCSKRDADRIIQSFAGVALDNREMKFAIIDTSNIASRVKFPAAPPRTAHRAPVPNRRPAGKPAGKGAGKPAGKPAGTKKGKKPKREPQVKKTVEELDAELDAYMAHA
ncbi:hypothetical protein CAEBREN_06776 [Caenorhabditis brenneri]|uniref:Chromatin target of PRMT1 protein C-terminal domain-containing protein n=1 Tax=Caenorhabditis brenneri TaxID=135651 RepID=G0NMM8_CAEBE|nr:hypothetical protein CAEBREN_06776 [Caenorhabditis brenneri]